MSFLGEKHRLKRCSPSSREKGVKKSSSLSGHLVVRTQLRPLDVYAYLRARFGIPNGFQNFLRRDDSDNWIHWDFNLKADDVDVYIQGTSREIHFMIAESITDQNWKNIIVGLKKDFGRVGRAKSDMTRSFEKFVVFQNKFITLAQLCAEIHGAITDATESMATSIRSESRSKPFILKESGLSSLMVATIF
ncbi:hypothetical protein [Phyllobacterium sp. CCNWLW11]|uniref:hypothetical protein n=1 Tax=Phyllobacterium sp. CCNWLW11 TaxID=3126384 RepID=UPI003012B28A